MPHTPQSWEHLDNRRAARELQSFRCTTDHPRSDVGRRSLHPRPWEWEAQAYLRDVWKRLMPGELVLVTRDGTSSARICAAIWLRFPPMDGVEHMFLAAAGVSLSMRGSGGQLADALMTEAISIGAQRAKSHSMTRLVVTGKIHVENRASQNMVARAGFEPLDVETPYQTWGLVRQV